MKVSKLMRRQVETVQPHDSLARAAQLMWEHDIGCVPVVDDEYHVVGVVTDRDICMHAYMQGSRLADLRVSGAMAHEVISCTPDDTLQEAERIMQRARVRRLPVVSDDEVLQGILSVNDIAAEAVRVQGRKRRDVELDEVAVTFAEVSRPRSRPSA